MFLQITYNVSTLYKKYTATVAKAIWKFSQMQTYQNKMNVFRKLQQIY